MRDDHDLELADAIAEVRARHAATVSRDSALARDGRRIRVLVVVVLLVWAFTFASMGDPARTAALAATAVWLTRRPVA